MPMRIYVYVQWYVAHAQMITFETSAPQMTTFETSASSDPALSGQGLMGKAQQFGQLFFMMKHDGYPYAFKQGPG